MKIDMIILDGKRNKEGYIPPLKLNFLGDYAIENCILKLSEIYFGLRIRNKIEDLLKLRRNDNENN